jgi:hypothetical protein
MYGSEERESGQPLSLIRLLQEVCGYETRLKILRFLVKLSLECSEDIDIPKCPC